MHGIQETISTLYISPKYCLLLRLTAIVGLIRMDTSIFGWLRAALFFILTFIILDWEICWRPSKYCIALMMQSTFYFQEYLFNITTECAPIISQYVWTKGEILFPRIIYMHNNWIFTFRANQWQTISFPQHGIMQISLNYHFKISQHHIYLFPTQLGITYWLFQHVRIKGAPYEASLHAI